MQPHRPLALLLTAALALTLGACGKEPDSPTASNEATLTGPDAKPGLVASDGKLMLPVIAGRPAAAYFTVRNDGAEPVTLAAVSILGAGKAEMHQTNGGSMGKVDSLPIDPGASVVFAPGGLHVMAFELPATLKAGGKAELTMTFSDGDKLSMPLDVEKMGGDMGGMGNMEGMHH
ncbi:MULTISPECIES: copper chaperone PCu(A)C [unclassified Novosphingobium]|uniref:copper chaperone PCu(A)C n=1 Tax=unclassified Novosphingobium TaxID=2644732 RepID=UPI001F40EC6B|nr:MULTISPECIES: copper chaperone PCu(A)C [unclassified Novosphingobium]